MWNVWIVIITSCLVATTACTVPLDSCNVTVVMPQHSGSTTLAAVLSDINAFKDCAHRHTTYPHWIDSFFIVLVANPFKRVLSRAFYQFRNVNVVSKEGNYMNSPERFRGWLRAKATRNGLRSMLTTEFLGPNKPSFILRTAVLQSDLDDLCLFFGYPPVQISHSHCVSSCPDGRVDQYRVKTLKHVDRSHWYDEEAEKMVLSLFQRDFEVFNISTSLSAMYDVPPFGGLTPHALQTPLCHERETTP